MRALSYLPFLYLLLLLVLGLFTIPSSWRLVAPLANKYENATMITTLRPKIPHRLIFTSKHNILESKEPPIFYDNIQHTIQQYRKAWGEPNAPVWFLNDTECRDVVREANSSLLAFFDMEKKGPYKSDICRVAALYLKGGYYFDIDMEVVQPVLLSNATTFSTVDVSGHSFFQSFLASEPNSPILREAFAEMIQWYSNPRAKDGWMGPTTLKTAFDKVPTKGQVRILQEISLVQSGYSLPLRVGTGCCCNYIVHDPQERVVYFYSRIVGAGPHCMS